MRRPGFALGAVFLVAAAVAAMPALALLRRSWPWRVGVEGHSMEPTLMAGDWLLVDPLPYRRVAPQAGELVVARDPRLPTRWLVKRVAAVEKDGRLQLGGDHPAHGSEYIGPVDPELVLGRPWLRYWPLSRAGRPS